MNATHALQDRSNVRVGGSEANKSIVGIKQGFFCVNNWKSNS